LRKASILLLAGALVTLGGSANAAVISLAGHLDDPGDPLLIGADPWAPLPPAPVFTSDPWDSINNVVVYTFALADATPVRFRTFSFGLGGIDPYFSLFNGSGGTAVFLESNYVQAFSTGGDIDMTFNLAAGSYTTALSAFANMSLAENYSVGTLGDGFTGLGSYGGTGDPLYYNLEISSEAAPIPEPTTLLLAASGLLGLAVNRRRRTGR